VLTVTVISVVLGTATLALLVSGIVLVVVGTFLWKIVGIVVVGAAVELRPRLPGIPATPGCKTRSDVPALFAVADTVGSALGAPKVHAIVVDETFDASCTRVGFRRRPVLFLGLPLWASLTAAGRGGLLAHQLAHLVDHDPEQDLWTQPALSTISTLARATRRRSRMIPPVEIQGGKNGEISAGQYTLMIIGGANSQMTFGGKGIVESIAQTFANAAMMPFHWLFTRLDRRLRAVTSHGRQRAEYYADALAVQVAGSAATIEYCEALLLHDDVYSTARRWLRVGADPETVCIEATERITNHATDMRLREQHSMRTESSPFAGHPPIGRRLRVLRSRPTSVGRLTPDTLDFAAADAQLQPDFRRVARALAHLP
jgi:Zn-dependent protease with chaperone function